MQIGLIGYGAWGSHHAAAIVETAGLELTAVCSSSEESRQSAAEKYRVPVFSGYRELLASPDVGAVDIVLPTHLHREVAGAAFESGKHVLLEKPMALTPEECTELISLARRAGRILYVGHELRHSPQWGGMRRLIEDGRIGQPLYATIDLWRRPYRFGSGNWRYDARRVGSWILEEPIHFFDLAAWWMRRAGWPESVFARGSKLAASPEGLWDNLSAVLSFQGGAHATVTQTLAACEHHLSAKVVGEHGALLAFWDGEMDRTTHPLCSLKLARDGRLEDIPIDPTGEYHELRAQMAHLAAVARGECKPIITPEEAALAVSVCWAAERSARSGLPENI
ncbi:MAG: Gfo/Idh/MocA family protein [Bryobacteraceae bacterium]